jgi:hypothetical protein
MPKKTALATTVGPFLTLQVKHNYGRAPGYKSCMAAEAVSIMLLQAKPITKPTAIQTRQKATLLEQHAAPAD